MCTAHAHAHVHVAQVSLDYYTQTDRQNNGVCLSACLSNCTHSDEREIVSLLYLSRNQVVPTRLPPPPTLAPTCRSSCLA